MINIFNFKNKAKETSNIINLESGAIKSFLDSWTYVHALLVLSDNANDAGATNFEVSQHRGKDGKINIIVKYDGKPFTYDELYDYLRVFSYHVALKKDTAGLRGCGRRWAFYTLCGYRNWDTPTTSEVVLFSYNKDEKKIHNGSLTIRFPKQADRLLRKRWGSFQESWLQSSLCPSPRSCDWPCSPRRPSLL